MNYLKTSLDDHFLLVFILKLCQKLCGTALEISETELSPQCFKYIFFPFLSFPAKLSYKKYTIVIALGFLVLEREVRFHFSGSPRK